MQPPPPLNWGLRNNTAFRQQSLAGDSSQSWMNHCAQPPIPPHFLLEKETPLAKASPVSLVSLAAYGPATPSLCRGTPAPH